MAKLGNTAKRIIEFIWAHGESTEREVIDAIRPSGKSKRWGNSYFLIGRGNGRHSSLFRRGLIDSAGIDRVTGARLWDITPAALEVVLGPGFSDSIVTADEVIIPPLPDEELATATDDDGFPADDIVNYDIPPDPGDYEPSGWIDADPFSDDEADWAAARHFSFGK